jgi:hypothetical protein
LRHAVPAVHGSYPHKTANAAQQIAEERPWTRNDGDAAFSLHHFRDRPYRTDPLGGLSV